MPTDPLKSTSGRPGGRGPVVFIITRGDSVGGAQIHVRDLAARLHAEGEAVLVLLGSTGPFTDDLDQRNVPWRTCPGLARSIHPLRDIRAVREVHRMLLRVRPRLVSTHTAKAGLAGRLAACWAGVPVLFTVHGWQFAPGIPRLQRLLVYGLELVLSRLPGPQRVITVSRFDLRLARRSGAVPLRRLRLVYNGLPEIGPGNSVTPVREHIAATPPPHRPPRLIMIARFQAQKDHATLLRALAEAPGPWELLLAGEEGPLSKHVQDLAEEMGFEKRWAAGRDTVAGEATDGPPARAPANGAVAFLGHRSDIAELLAASDLYCLATNWEGLPRSIIEAMRAGLPVVASDVGGVRELVQDGVTGRVVPRGDVGALAHALRTLLGSGTDRRRMGIAARHRYEAFFTFEAMYQKTRKVWNELPG